LGVLRDSPQFQQLRQLVQSNPQLLEPIIQNIAQGNPQLAALINQNPEAFLQLLAEGGGDGGEGGALPPRAIQVTPEEAEAIGRVSHSIHTTLTISSWNNWDFLDIWLFKPILHVIRMKRSLRIISLNMDLMTKKRTMPQLRKHRKLWNEVE